MKLVVTILAALSLAPAALADSPSHDAEEKASAEARSERIRVVSIEGLSKLMADGKAIVFDVNGAETRRKFGTIPGAKLLASSSAYELGELPADKETLLVFYCANPRCTASDTAAKRAKEAGYDVAILREGIAGWAAAGKATAEVPAG